MPVRPPSPATTGPIRAVGQPCADCQSSVGTVDAAASTSATQSNGRPEQPARPGDEHADGQARGEEHRDEELVEQGEGEHRAGGEQQAVLPGAAERSAVGAASLRGAQPAHEQPEQQGPEERVEVEVASRWLVASRYGEIATAARRRGAARGAGHPAPRVEQGGEHDVPGRGQRAGRRSTTRLPGARWSSAAASNGTRGGWSAYPQAGRAPAARK